MLILPITPHTSAVNRLCLHPETAQFIDEPAMTNSIDRPPRYEFERKIWQFTRTVSYQQEPPQTMRMRRHRFVVLRYQGDLKWHKVFDQDASARGSGLDEIVAELQRSQQHFFLHDPLPYSKDTRIFWQGIDQINMEIILGEAFTADDFQPLVAGFEPLQRLPTRWDFLINTLA